MKLNASIIQSSKNTMLSLIQRRNAEARLLALLLILCIAFAMPGYLAQASTLTVNTTADDDVVNGNCTLREAIIAARDNSTKDACGTGGTVDLITFSINSASDPGCDAGSKICTIQPATPLPSLHISGNITIDGYSQSDASPADESNPAKIRIEIDGSLIETGTPYGIYILSPNNVVKGLAINRFSSGIVLAGSSAMNNTIQGCYLGTDPTGTSDLGNSDSGVWVSDAGSGNQIGGNLIAHRNIISGNDANGVYLSSDTTGTTISGNYIGTTANGLSALPNVTGITLRHGVYSNTIGGSASGAGNLISGNTSDGITINGGTTDPHDNTIEGNWIGVDASGLSALPNGQNGIQLLNGTNHNTIGPDNLISGNVQSAVLIWTLGTNDNQVKGNLIGTDHTGTSAIPNMNSLAAVYIQGEASANVIGGSTVDERNVISGNNAQGVRISGSGTMNNVISANLIGLDVSGDNALKNGTHGVVVTNGASNTVIGGDADGEGNVIVATGVPVVIEVGAFNTIVSGNLIGTDICGTTSMGGGTGVSISGGSFNNTIGGTTVDERNVITGTVGFGVRINGPGTDGNHVLGNYIGVDIGGTNPLSNGNSGVRIENSAQHNTIGPNNIIAHHIYEGIYAYDADTDFNIFTRNSIYANGNVNLALGSGSNEDISPPTITSTGKNPSTISGTLSPTCIGCTIEVFTSQSNYPRAGRTYLGDVTTNGSGTWTITPSSLAGPYLTATVTNPTMGTSEYSTVYFVPLQYLYLPIVDR